MKLSDCKVGDIVIPENNIYKYKILSLEDNGNDMFVSKLLRLIDEKVFRAVSGIIEVELIKESEVKK
jgi:hypothetical protein